MRGERDRGESGQCFPGTAAAKILVGDNNITPLHLSWKAGVGIFHAMPGQFPGIKGIQITGRNNGIGINIGAEFMNFA
jgi:hypothetical protein